MEKKRKFRKLIFITLISILISTSISGESNAAKITQQDLIYFALTDRFYNGDLTNDQNVRKRDLSTYHGGDWQGIIDKLDYIKDLGFTTIWISPLVANQIRGYHGYWAIDFYKPNQNFGNMGKIKELVTTAHAKGIKVIADLVVNHVSPMHPWYNDPQYANWFHQRGAIINWNDQQEIEEGRLANLPDLDQSNPEVKRYLIDMAKWWIRETGIDGYRLDTVRHVSKSFWKEFVAAIKQEYPNFFFIGEVFDGRTSYVADYQNAGLDGLLDYPVYFALNEVFKNDRPVSQLIDVISECHNTYSNCNLMGTFIDNHDVPRFVNQIINLPAERLKQALAFIMTYTGIPVIYYGTEIVMDGGADPGNRMDMDWSSDSAIREYLKKLTAIRRNNKALIYGDFEPMNASPTQLCYLRRFEGNIIMSVFNLSDQKTRVELALPDDLLRGKGSLFELTGAKGLNAINGKIKFTMAPRQVNIFSYRENTFNLNSR
jgi:alpha-amylase